MELDPVKERENLKFNFRTNFALFSIIKWTQFGSKICHKKKFEFFCYFSNKIHYIQADFSERKFSGFKYLQARFHKRKSWSKHSTQDTFFSTFATFRLWFLSMYFKSETQSCFFLSQFFVAVSIYHKYNFRFSYRQIIIMQVE